jgi:2-dehydro-3-deoxygluconokinase
MQAPLHTKILDIVALGEAMVEFNQTRPGEPLYLQGFGGDTSNAAIAAARAGATTAYLTRLGHDLFGDQLLQLWATEQVDCTGVERDVLAHTGIYFVTHGARGHMFSYLRAGSAASRMTPDWLVQDAVRNTIASAKILHVSGISLAISKDACRTVLAALWLAKAAQTLVSFDSNLRLKLWPLQEAQAVIPQVVALCDVFLPSLEDMQTLTGLCDPHAIVDWSHQHGAGKVVLKLGSEGALASDGSRREHVASHHVTLVDATGAGDCFCGNLLARLTRGDDLFAATRYANAAAALAVQGYGAVAPLPTGEQVLRVLKALGRG